MQGLPSVGSHQEDALHRHPFLRRGTETVFPRGRKQFAYQTISFVFDLSIRVCLDSGHAALAPLVFRIFCGEPLHTSPENALAIEPARNPPEHVEHLLALAAAQ